MVGRFPDELWRISVACRSRRPSPAWSPGTRRPAIRSTGQRPTPTARRGPAASLGPLERLWPLLLGLALLLLVDRRRRAVADGARRRPPRSSVGSRRPLGRRRRRRAAVVRWCSARSHRRFLNVVDAAVGYDDWGGFMLNLFLAARSIALCFPLGVLLACLGPAVEAAARAGSVDDYIEVFRGVPCSSCSCSPTSPCSSSSPPADATRRRRSGRSSCSRCSPRLHRRDRPWRPAVGPRGQTEAAKALGLSPVRMTGLIVLPQALRNVIPAQIGQFISLFKDTTLPAQRWAVRRPRGRRAITAQPEFRGQGLTGETLPLRALLFWVGSNTMSRESQRLERELGWGRDDRSRAGRPPSSPTPPSRRVPATR